MEKTEHDDNSVSISQEAIATTFDNLMRFFIVPEIEKRQKNGNVLTPFELRAAQIVFFPDNEKKIIRLNDEVKAYSKILLKPGIGKKKGESICLDEIQEIKQVELTEVDNPNCAHVFISWMWDKWFISFDFRYNKQLAKKYLSRANEFLKTSEYCLNNQYWGAFYDTLFSALELIAHAFLLLSPSLTNQKKESHFTVKDKFNKTINNGGLSREYSRLFSDLYKYRLGGRYLKKKVTFSKNDALKHYTLVEKLRDEIDSLIKP